MQHCSVHAYHSGRFECGGEALYNRSVLLRYLYIVNLQELAAVRGALLAAVARDAASVQADTLLHLLAVAR